MSLPSAAPRAHFTGAAVPGVTSTADELLAFAASSGVGLQFLVSGQGMSFGRGADGDLVLTAPASVPLDRVLAFLRKVVARHQSDNRVDAVRSALKAVAKETGDPALAALADAFAQCAGRSLNSTGHALDVIGATLSSMPGGVA
ncbi:hypothetical protein [Streptomyces sp. NPDC047097]|uniref:hypothetical protein n=1 Tax=Streptomyces sp. NPDC047097 TaxID=3155260 RepID=UPI00340713BF